KSRAGKDKLVEGAFDDQFRKMMLKFVKDRKFLEALREGRAEDELARLGLSKSALDGLRKKLEGNDGLLNDPTLKGLLEQIGKGQAGRTFTDEQKKLFEQSRQKLGPQAGINPRLPTSPTPIQPQRPSEPPRPTPGTGPTPRPGNNRPGDSPSWSGLDEKSTE